jgi:GDPmannose 4,6-dehydratase
METSYDIMNILSIDEAKKFAIGKKAIIITGVTGQDGSFMVDYLLKNTDYEIFGGARRLSVANHENLKHLVDEPRFHLINFDLTDEHSISQTVRTLQPAYFINFAAQSFVKSSWDFPAQTWDTNTTSIIHILEAIRIHCPKCRFYNAGSSEEFGNVEYSPQDEAHPLRPRSPYGASKAAARHIVKVYRESYGIYAIQGWLFNHEGTRRGEEFVTRKITKAVNRIKKEINSGIMTPVLPLELGNLDAKRDWSDAEDMVDAVWRMLNQEFFNYKIEMKLQDDAKTDIVPLLKEYVVASGETHSIREFVELAFKELGMDNIVWDADGEGVTEVLWYKNGDNVYKIVKINPAFYRPAEVERLLGQPSQIRHDLGWSPKVNFRQLVHKMVQQDSEINNDCYCRY